MQTKDVYTAEEQQLLMDSLKNNEPLVLEMLEERKKLLEEFPQMRWAKITTNGLRILYNLETPFENSNPLLICAALYNCPFVVDQLFTQGANVNAVGDCDFTALHSASCHGFSTIIGMLLAKGADISAINGYGDTPLHTAVINGHMAAVKLLIAKGAPIHVRNNDGQTVFECAISNGYPHIAAYIEELSLPARAGQQGLPARRSLHMASDSPLAPPSSFTSQTQIPQTNTNMVGLPGLGSRTKEL